jgi:predicted RNase H-like HicB family nuclease
MGLEDATMKFPIVIHKDAGSSYGVIVPDLPGCFSGGDTLEEALVSSKEAIICHVQGMLMHGQPIPEKKDISLHKKDELLADGFWASVDVDVSKINVENVDINITVPSPILDLIDDIAAQDGESRSGLVARAVLEYAWIRVEDK